MKKKLIIILFILGIFTNCSSEENEISKTSVTIKFTHNWNGTPVTQLDFNDFKPVVHYDLSYKSCSSY